MTPRFRFTIYNSIVAPTGVVVNEPLGFRQIKVSLERDKVYHSLVEFFKSNFIWYGSAMTILETIASTQGPNAIVNIDIDINFGEEWEGVFKGLVDLSQKEKIIKGGTYYKMSAPIIRDDFWSKFMNNKSIPVDLGTINKITLPLPPQKLRLRYSGDSGDLATILDPGIRGTSPTLTTGYYYQVDFTNEILSEIEQKFNLELGENQGLPVSLVTAKYAGSYQFSINVMAWRESLGGSRTPMKDPLAGPPYDLMDFYINIDGTEYVFTHTEEFWNGVDLFDGRVSKFTYSSSHPVNQKSFIRIYGKANSNASGFTFVWCASTLVIKSSMTIAADTVYPATTTDAFLLKQLIINNLQGTIGVSDPLVSTVFDGCKGRNAVMKGKHVRGNSFTSKSLFMSFDDIWDGIDPIFCLGLGYTEVDGVKKIKIESREIFYDDIPVIYLSNVKDLTEVYDTDKYIKSIEIGYQKSSAESEGGTDDVQSKRTYRTIFSTIGTDVKVLSKWFLAALGIEQTRRNRVEFGKDWRLDEDTMMISVKDDGLGGYTPEVGTDFASVTNILNSDTRYNIRHSVARVFKRFQKWFQGCLQLSIGSNFTFTGGELNYDMTSQLNPTDCEAASDPDPVLSEKQNIVVTSAHNFVPKIYKCSAPWRWVTWNVLKANRDKALGVSSTKTGYLPMFIIDFNYHILGGKAEMILLLRSETALPDPPGFRIFDDSFGPEFE